MLPVQMVILSAFVLTCWGCKPSPKASHASEVKLNTEVTKDLNFDFIWEAKPVTKDRIPSILDSLCDSISYEVTDLYPGTTSIPDDDWLIFDDSLNKRGFKVVNVGRGNWQNGPRIFTMILENSSCACRIDKLYYTDSNAKKQYYVTERIACLPK